LIWKPTLAFIRQNPYIIVYRVSDGIYTNDYTVLYTVEGELPNNPTSISDVNYEGSMMRIFPNPTADVLNIDFKMDEDKFLMVEIYDIYGSLKYSTGNMNVEKNDRIVLDEMNLTSGSYVIVVKSGDELVEHGKFIVQN